MMDPAGEHINLVYDTTTITIVGLLMHADTRATYIHTYAHNSMLDEKKTATQKHRNSICMHACVRVRVLKAMVVHTSDA